MPTSHAAINPLLISTLTGQPLSSIPEKPTASLLPGVLTKLIAKHKKQINPHFGSNKQVLICGHCGSKGHYDLGFVAFNLDRWQKDEKDSAGQHTQRDIFDYVQTTGYFRCKQCNRAGNWGLKDPLFIDIYRLGKAVIVEQLLCYFKRIFITSPYLRGIRYEANPIAIT
jgi:hypothetical protein